MITWRAANEADDERVADMFVELNREDPGQQPVPRDHMLQTLRVLRAQPERGRAVVLDDGGVPVGYALLISFWSNELGGACCSLDELFVASPQRSRGHGRALIEALDRGSALWPEPSVAVVLEVSPDNARALALYRRLGFEGKNVSLRLPRARSAPA